MSASPLDEGHPSEVISERRANLAFLVLILLVALGAAALNGAHRGVANAGAPKVEARN